MLEVLALPEAHVHVHSTRALPPALAQHSCRLMGLVIVTALLAIVKIFAHQRTSLDGLERGIPLLFLSVPCSSLADRHMAAQKAAVVVGTCRGPGIPWSSFGGWES